MRLTYRAAHRLPSSLHCTLQQKHAHVQVDTTIPHTEALQLLRKVLPESVMGLLHACAPSACSL